MKSEKNAHQDLRMQFANPEDLFDLKTSYNNKTNARHG